MYGQTYVKQAHTGRTKISCLGYVWSIYTENTTELAFSISNLRRVLLNRGGKGRTKVLLKACACLIQLSLYRHHYQISNFALFLKTGVCCIEVA